MSQIAVDSSAIIAILFEEDGHEELHAFLRRASVDLLIGAPTLLEIYMVLSGRDQFRPELIVATLMAGKRHRVVAFDDGMVSLAHAAFLQFGKGQHPARLNYGDCMAYAIARTFDVPLLYKGNDFRATDIRSALA